MGAIRLFLTGEPGCGKTTAIRELARILIAKGMKPGGMISGEIRKAGVRIGFSLEDLATKQTGVLAHMEQTTGPRVGKYRVNLVGIEQVGVTSIRRAIVDADVIIVDELGTMELCSKPFVSAVEMALNSPKPFVGTIHKRASHYLLTAIRSDASCEIVEVTKENREEIPSLIAQRMTRHV